MAPISSSKKGSEVEVKEDIWSDLLSSLKTRTTSRGAYHFKIHLFISGHSS